MQRLVLWTTQLTLTSKPALIEAPNPGTSIKAGLETASPVARRTLYIAVIPPSITNSDPVE
ncbi:hypothetical protein A8O18_11680 [Lentilactobacillus parabuchneri]|nr:hypothetical protein A8O18_11680 [Lentilactobacillus parabuchneri]OCB81706.1 hypothetical protein A7322_11230 [Lentilactobacillus parabuchneri]